jgi:hypothetical protein
MTNNKQQTAVEWFSIRRDVLEIEVRLGKLSPIEYAEELTKAEQQAKEMEKERAIKFACDVHMNVKKDKVKSLMQLVDEKYNETYGGDQQ